MKRFGLSGKRSQWYPTADDAEMKRIQAGLFSDASPMRDPCDAWNLSTIQKNSSEIEAKYQYLQLHPLRIKHQYRKAYLIGIFGTPIIGYFTYLYFQYIGGSEDGDGNMIFLLLLPRAYLAYLNRVYRNLAIDIIKLQIAKLNGWTYNPSQDRSKRTKLKNSYKELFDKGNQNQRIEDQFRGQISKESQVYDFYCGDFYYEVKSRSSKNKSVSKYKRHFFCIHLPKTLDTTFRISPENGRHRFVNNGRGSMLKKKKKEIETAFNDFNKRYVFSYTGEKQDKERDILEILTPAVQVQLTELAKQKKGCNVLFTGDTVIFYFEGYLFNKLKSNFKHSLEVKKEDSEHLSQQLYTLIDISSEIVKYLD